MHKKKSPERKLFTPKNISRKKVFTQRAESLGRKFVHTRILWKKRLRETFQEENSRKKESLRKWTNVREPLKDITSIRQRLLPQCKVSARVTSDRTCVLNNHEVFFQLGSLSYPKVVTRVQDPRRVSPGN